MYYKYETATRLVMYCANVKIEIKIFIINIRVLSNLDYLVLENIFRKLLYSTFFLFYSQKNLGDYIILSLVKRKKSAQN